MEKDMKPIIGITMGDPAGIGPAICIEALMQESVYKICKPIIIGCSGIIRRAMHIKNVILT